MSEIIVFLNHDLPSDGTSLDPNFVLGKVKNLEVTQSRNSYPIKDLNGQIVDMHCGPLIISGTLYNLSTDCQQLINWIKKSIPFNIWSHDNKFDFRTELINCYATSVDYLFGNINLDFQAEECQTVEHLTYDEKIVKDIIV